MQLEWTRDLGDNLCQRVLGSVKLFDIGNFK